MNHIKEYRYAYGAVEPIIGENFFLIMPYCNTDCMNVFLKEISKAYKDDMILLVCDGATWHKSKGLKIPENIDIIYIPPCMLEMNPIEQIWKQIRSMNFKNEVFKPLDDVVKRICDAINQLTKDMVKSITHRDLIIYVNLISV
ncbi:transposase [Peptoniphilus rhinitidis]|jgi:transposase|uniref:transposase n=1 Tax=Peptoniphilus rhinitidis TaxID=1175452 RepID=UPI002353DACB|nr:transposase [Peptoniphilus rhinitidis]